MAAFDLLADTRRSPPATPSVNPMAVSLISREPAFDVRMSTTFRKSAFRPVLSVKVAWSMTCSRML